MNFLHKFEAVLLSSRYIVLIPVIACVLISFLLIGIVTIEVGQLPGHLRPFVDTVLPESQRTHLYSEGIASIARIIDGYLFAMIMLIFAMGLYELFIGKIVVREEHSIAARLLLVSDIDDLKDRLTKVVFLILIVTYFEYALRGTYDTGIELLYLAGGIALVATSIWLTSRSGKH